MMYWIVKGVEFAVTCSNILVDELSLIEKLSFDAFNDGSRLSCIIRNELARVRAMRMEGSFGTQIEYYGLKRIKAWMKQTEIRYIFFGIQAADIV